MADAIPCGVEHISAVTVVYLSGTTSWFTVIADVFAAETMVVTARRRETFAIGSRSQNGSGATSKLSTVTAKLFVYPCPMPFNWSVDTHLTRYVPMGPPAITKSVW